MRCDSRAFQRKKPLLPLQAPAIAFKMSVASNDPITRDSDRDGIADTGSGQRGQARYPTDSAHLDSCDGIFLVGNILQELLDGLRPTKQFDRLLTLLDPCPFLDLNRQTYVAAARLQSVCRLSGVNAGSIDFLIAAACCQHGFSLLTADKDFVRIARHCDLVTLPI